MQYRTHAPGDAWKDLRYGRNEERGISLPTVAHQVETGHGSIRYALGPDGEPRLLLPISMHEKLPDFNDSPGLTVREATYSQNGRPVRFLDLMCRIPELESVFSEVVYELMERIRTGIPCAKALQDTLGDFRALLMAVAEREVADETILGLAGELLVLERLVRRSPSSWSTWMGPKGDRHDFRHGNVSMEVKTGSRRSSTLITISSVNQLAPPKGGSLFLASIILEKTVNGELDISRLFKRVADLSDNPGEVRKLVQAAGCHDPTSEAWNRLSFNVESENYYAVSEGFPSITPESFSTGSIPAGIDSLTYVIDLAVAEQFKLDGDKLNALEGLFLI